MHGYRWYDWATGAVDRRRLAEDAASGLTNETFSEAPPWILGLPASLPDADPNLLATIDARARNALLDHMSGAREGSLGGADVGGQSAH